MLEIVCQHEDESYGNDCLIKDCVVWMKCHEKHIVMIGRRYIGWCDHGLNYRCRKEFDDSQKALDYYWDMVNNRNKY